MKTYRVSKIFTNDPRGMVSQNKKNGSKEKKILLRGINHYAQNVPVFFFTFMPNDGHRAETGCYVI